MEDALQKFAKMIQIHKYLSSFEFCTKGQIKDVQFIQISKSLRQLTRLTKLHLYLQYSRQVTEKGIKAFTQSIENNLNLKDLVLDFFGTDEPEVTLAKINIISSLKALQALTVLVIKYFIKKQIFNQN